MHHGQALHVHIADADPQCNNHCDVSLCARFDDLENYSNERSIFLAKLRDAIEAPWQEWELQQLPEQEKLPPPEVRLITHPFAFRYMWEADRC